MKRTFDQTTKDQPNPDEEGKDDGLSGKTLYGVDGKRRKLSTQRLGDFIVKAKDAVHFKIVSSVEQIDSEGSESFFEPKFLYWLFGEEERICGYENLSITICLSARRLIPFVQISYEKKAPGFLNKVDNIEEMIRKHYGTIYTDKEVYAQEVLKMEQVQWTLPGTQFSTLGEEGKPDNFLVRRVRLSDSTFHEQNFYAQALLPFFIEGASPVEPSPFWNYFLVYGAESKELVALFTVYEAHLTFDQFRTKISQVLVLPPYQRKGIASRVYEQIYNEYRLNTPHCFQVMTEDAADDFQKVQDITHSKIILNALKEQSQADSKLSFKAMPDAIDKQSQIKDAQLSKAQILHLAKLLKLPSRVILQINDLLVYSRLTGSNEAVKAEYRLTIKRRLYLRCMNAYPELFVGARERLTNKAGGLKEPYLYNEVLEDDQFARKTGEEEDGQIGDGAGQDQMALLTAEASKIQLKSMFDESCKMFDAISKKVASFK